MKHNMEIADNGLTRRKFVKSCAGAVIAASLLPLVDWRSLAFAQSTQQAAVKGPVALSSPTGNRSG